MCFQIWRVRAVRFVRVHTFFENGVCPKTNICTSIMADWQALAVVSGHSRHGINLALKAEVVALHKAAAECEQAAQASLCMV